MTDERLRKEKRIFSEKKKVLAVLNNAKEGMTFAEIAKQLPIKPLRIKGLLIALLKSKDVIHTDNLWIACTKTTIIPPSPPVCKQEPLYPNFDEEHEKWQKQILAKKRFNPFGK